MLSMLSLRSRSCETGLAAAILTHSATYIVDERNLHGSSAGIREGFRTEPGIRSAGTFKVAGYKPMSIGRVKYYSDNIEADGRSARLHPKIRDSRSRLVETSPLRGEARALARDQIVDPIKHHSSRGIARRWRGTFGCSRSTTFCRSA
jgi:hypothetical protein